MDTALDLVQESAEAIPWTKATYIRPHEYFLRKDHPAVYDLLKQAVAEHGYDAYFYSSLFRYLTLGDYKYWIYDTLINRERLDLAHPARGQGESHEGCLPAVDVHIIAEKEAKLHPE